MNKEVTLCEAKSFEIEKQWSKAATQYALAGMPAKAAKLFEQEQQWSKAAEQYELAGMPEKADDCRHRLSLSCEQSEVDSYRIQNIRYQTIADVNTAMPKVETID